MENNLLLSYVALPNVDTFHYTIPRKITFVNRIDDLISKKDLISIGRLSSSQCQITRFPKL